MHVYRESWQSLEMPHGSALHVPSVAPEHM
jgi:hypothetical protein